MILANPSNRILAEGRPEWPDLTYGMEENEDRGLSLVEGAGFWPNWFSKILAKMEECRDEHGSPKVRASSKGAQKSLNKDQSRRESLLLSSWPDFSQAPLSIFSTWPQPWPVCLLGLQSPVLAQILLSQRETPLNLVTLSIWSNSLAPTNLPLISDHPGLPLARILLGQISKKSLLTLDVFF